MIRSQKEQQENMLRNGTLPHDIGMLPDTFVLPRQWSERRNWPMAKKWMKARAIDVYS